VTVNSFNALGKTVSRRDDGRFELRDERGTPQFVRAYEPALDRVTDLLDLVAADRTLSGPMREICTTVIIEWFGYYTRLYAEKFLAESLDDAYRAVQEAAKPRLRVYLRYRARDRLKTKLERPRRAREATERQREMRARKRRNWMIGGQVILGFLGWALLGGVLADYLGIRVDSERGERFFGLYAIVSVAIIVLVERAFRNK